ncbi:MAG: PilZ domain-containing protein [Planctomycetota bacterium]
METPTDRRRHSRTSIARDAKLFHRASWAYITCRTVDASSRGLLVQIKSDRPLAVGDIVDAAVGWTGAPVVRADEFINARVVRIDTTPDGDCLAALALTREVIGLTQFIQAA